MADGLGPVHKACVGAGLEKALAEHVRRRLLQQGAGKVRAIYQRASGKPQGIHWLVPEPAFDIPESTRASRLLVEQRHGRGEVLVAVKVCDPEPTWVAVRRSLAAAVGLAVRHGGKLVGDVAMRAVLCLRETEEVHAGQVLDGAGQIVHEHAVLIAVGAVVEVHEELVDADHAVVREVVDDSTVLVLREKRYAQAHARPRAPGRKHGRYEPRHPGHGQDQTVSKRWVLGREEVVSGTDEFPPFYATMAPKASWTGLRPSRGRCSCRSIPFRCGLCGRPRRMCHCGRIIHVRKAEQDPPSP